MFLQSEEFLEAHRALEQLEEYHASLVSSNSAELKREIEKLINNFKGALFQSLIGSLISSSYVRMFTFR